MKSSKPLHRALRWTLFAQAGAGAMLSVGVAGAWWLRAHGLTLGELQTEMRQRGDPRFEWRSIDKKHWQALARPPSDEAPELTDAREGTGPGCPTGMVRVKGNYRVELHGEATGEIERIQDAACTDWISRDFPARCRTFDREKIAQEIALLPTRPLDFCIDRFEYPNVFGQNPMIVVTFHEAAALCKKSSKRLCNENEWTFACEGEEVRPYPYGYTRDATACVMDRNWRPFAEGALSPRDGPGARAELDRLWQAEPSGSRGGCKSAFGVYDMTGNVDEWTKSARSTGYASVLKGGYWGPVRARCRPATRAHNEDFVAYQQGFRCCGAANTEVPAPIPTAMRSAADAGAVTVVATPPRPASSSAAMALSQGTSADDRSDDELTAISRARAGLARCASIAPGAPDEDGTSAAWAGLAIGIALAFGARSRGR